MSNPRLAAVRILLRVIQRGESLDRAIDHAAGDVGPLARELAHGVLRWHPRLRALAGRLLERPLRARDRDVELVILLGLYQLRELRTPDHAAIHSSVETVVALRKPWARGLVNAVLRTYQRDRDALEAEIEQDPEARWAHPSWLIERLQADWPDDFQTVLAAGNVRPPMTLRVNRLRTDRDRYRLQLEAAGIAALDHPVAPDALVLERAQEAYSLPGFGEGLVSIQDAGAQLAALWLAPGAGMRVLDACAAPGGKTAHILEIQPELAELVALDIDADRLSRVEGNLDRLGLNATVLQGDAARPEPWWDGPRFQRILLDAPCSATGVIRRHPDIKLLRRPEDARALALRQRAMLQALWPLLEPGGMLLYSTCSVLREENHGNIAWFLDQQGDAVLEQGYADCGHPEEAGCQILPGDQGMDGFFYAPIRRKI
jgi:16S rRNA (cytosine967-C5)-methyltransferase